MTEKDALNRLDKKERRSLLYLARKTIEAQLADIPLTLPPFPEIVFQRHLCVFVTLHKHGDLRGCIGTFIPNKPLYEQVCDMTVSCAFHDPRFRPLTSHELRDVEIEISVLSPLRPIRNIDEIEVGTHGIYIVQGPHGGVLLPQVATEYGWDRFTFLDQTCVKAGLCPGCWKDSSTEIYIFSAEIFSEESEGIKP